MNFLIILLSSVLALGLVSVLAAIVASSIKYGQWMNAVIGGLVLLGGIITILTGIKIFTN